MFVSCFFALLSGIFAALASFIMKYLSDYKVLEEYGYSGNSPSGITLKMIPYLLINLLMWIFFTKAISTTKSLPVVLSLNLFTNIALSTYLGYFYFEELVTSYTIIGLVIMSFGILVLFSEKEESVIPK